MITSKIKPYVKQDISKVNTDSDTDSRDNDAIQNQEYKSDLKFVN